MEADGLPFYMPTPVRQLLLLFSLAAARVLAADAPAPSAEGTEFFEQHIRPALIEYCYKCHSADAEKLKGELLLDTREGVLKGGESGPALVPGKPEDSLLIKAVRRLDKDLAMPPKKEMPPAVVDDFVAWVKMGAPDPRAGKSAVPVAKSEPKKIDYEAERKKWAYHKPEMPAVPEIRNPNRQALSLAKGSEPQGPELVEGIRNPIDAFILAKLDEQGLAPAPPAVKRTLLRRATFDLTGLPPTPDEITAFLADESPDAFAKVVERLLASPHYGERWSRHWLDVVRYADSLDSRGLGKDGDILDAWRYRDWVVNAFNRDLPFDQFVVQQVAGDILAAQQWDADKIVATGMYAIGNWGNGDADKEKLYTDIVDDQIDVTGRAFLGLTIGCARCHDHKFDPLTNADYYSLAGIFFSSHILAKFQSKGEGEKVARWPLLTPEQLAQRDAAQKRLVEIEAQLAGGLQPLTEVVPNVAGTTGLLSWHPKGADNPSLTINTTAADVKFSTITLAARAICLHPGPKTAATAAWRSPVSGRIRVSMRLSDADPNCGNGIDWAVRHGTKTIASGAMDNAGHADFPETEIGVQKGDLVRLVIGPRGEYSCDSTQTEFLLRAEDGTVWDLRDTLTSGAQQGHDGVWWICSGEGAQLGEEAPGRASIENERQQLNVLISRSEFAHGLQEGGIPATPYEGFHDARIHIRGRYDRLADVRPRVFPTLLAGDTQTPIVEGSGRLALARWLASADNPLTARVFVNRIWQHHFNAGLVRTVNNFGKLGEPPTHPELLDWLALEFVRSGWSVKAMHRLIMNSAAYQQGAEPRDAAAANIHDPANKLLSHFPSRRLSAEEVRDAMLTVTGALDRTSGGPSIGDLTQPRRTLYLTTIRSERATYQMLFDGADPNSIVEQRTDSVVAPQALWLLNHPFALAQAKALAQRLEREAPPDLPARVAWLYEHLFTRPPHAEETQRAVTALARLGGDAASWEQFCQVLLCANEFVYLD
jgi:cytochrome c553